MLPDAEVLHNPLQHFHMLRYIIEQHRRDFGPGVLGSIPGDARFPDGDIVWVREGDGGGTEFGGRRGGEDVVRLEEGGERVTNERGEKSERKNRK